MDKTVIRVFLFFFLFFIGLSCPLRASAEEVFTWRDCVKEAKKNHPDLVSAGEKLNQSKASKAATQSALLPQVSGSVDASTSKTNGARNTNTSFSSRSSSSDPSARVDSYAYVISGKQLLFDGFKTYYDVEQAVKNIEASRYNYDVTSSNVRLRLRTAFVDLLKAQELLKITQDIAKRRKQNKELIQLRYQAGREHRGSLLTAEANLAQAEFEVEQAKRNIALSERRLSKELGRTKLTPLQASGDLNVTGNETERPDFERLSESTPLLRELVVQKEAARWGVNSSIASLFPQVYANASAQRTDSVWPPHTQEWQAGASLSIPLFEGGNLMAGIAKTQAQYHQALADEKSGRDGVILTLEETWTQFQDALGQVAVGRQFLEAGQERAKIAESEYSAGLVSFNDWTIIEDNLVNIQKSFLDNQANALLTEASWFQAKGETLDAD